MNTKDSFEQLAHFHVLVLSNSSLVIPVNPTLLEVMRSKLSETVASSKMWANTRMQAFLKPSWAELLQTRAPSGAMVMTAFQNPCYARHFWDRAYSTRLYTEKGKLQEKYRNLRCRCGFARVEAGKTQRSHCFTASANHCPCPSSTSFLDHDPARTRACPYTAGACTTVMGSGWSRSRCVDKTVQSTSLGEVRPNVFCLRMMRLTAENWAQGFGLFIAPNHPQLLL